MKNDKRDVVIGKLMLVVSVVAMAVTVLVAARPWTAQAAATARQGSAPTASATEAPEVQTAFLAVRAPQKPALLVRAPQKPAAAPKAQKAPCASRDEGKRDLIQGSGTVRTFSFCAR
jgi:hypothetical protein